MARTIDHTFVMPIDAGDQGMCEVWGMPAKRWAKRRKARKERRKLTREMRADAFHAMQEQEDILDDLYECEQTEIENDIDWYIPDECEEEPSDLDYYYDPWEGGDDNDQCWHCGAYVYNCQCDGGIS